MQYVMMARMMTGSNHRMSTLYHCQFVSTATVVLARSRPIVQVIPDSRVCRILFKTVVRDDYVSCHSCDGWPHQTSLRAKLGLTRQDLRQLTRLTFGLTTGTTYWDCQNNVLVSMKNEFSIMRKKANCTSNTTVLQSSIGFHTHGLILF